MTNFEKWKENLKPEDLLRDDEKSGHKQSIFESCSVCPAHRFCDEWHKKFGDVADMVGLGSCENLFNEWAKDKVERTTPRRLTERELWKRMSSMKQSELYEAFGLSSGTNEKEETK